MKNGRRAAGDMRNYKLGGKMKSAAELQALLRQIDHKSYPAYKDTRGQYQFQQYVLSIDHVQETLLRLLPRSA